MNFFGKILVMIILVFSIFFMASSMLVYVTHTNWRDKIMDPQTGLRVELDKLTAQLSDAQSNRVKLEADVKNERESRRRDVSKLETQRLALEAERNTLQAQEATFRQQLADAVQAMQSTQDTLSKLRDEIVVLRTAVDTARNEREVALDKSIELQGKLDVADGELANLTRINERVAADLAKHQLALQDLGAQLDRGGPPRVQGKIVAFNDDGLMEINLGSDDGLEVGHTLEVFRDDPSKYLGRVEVIRTEADRLVARLIPQLRRGSIQLDDDVITRFEQIPGAEAPADDLSLSGGAP